MFHFARILPVFLLKKCPYFARISLNLSPYGEFGTLQGHLPQVLPAVAAERLGALEQEAEAVDVVGIDEGQFFPDIVPWWVHLTT